MCIHIDIPGTSYLMTRFSGITSGMVMEMSLDSTSASTPACSLSTPVYICGFS